MGSNFATPDMDEGELMDCKLFKEEVITTKII